MTYFQWVFYIFTSVNNEFIHAVGLMSGTSLDGLDLVYAKFCRDALAKFEILFAETVLYNDDWKHRLENSIYLKPKELAVLDSDFGDFLGKKTKKFMRKYQITSLNLIASHGHTVFHQPKKGITLQVGHGQAISNLTNCVVISDFRSQDIELGGQGAPLVPIGDRLLFPDYQACVNLGGFANISYENDHKRIAFDICPVNIVMNHYSRTHGCEYDDRGMLAAAGSVHEKLLSELNQLEYYRKSPPKSLGFEWVQESIFPLLKKYQIPSTDILRTFSEHTAHQIATIIKPFHSMLFTGGGVYNDFLMHRIQELGNRKIILPEDELVNYKEALIFALLGLLRLQGKENCLSSVTGAEKNHSSGKIFQPNNSN